MTLDLLPLLQPATIDEVSGEQVVALRMQSMGLRVGRQIMVIRRSRLGGPLQVRVGSTDLMLRPREARLVRLRTGAP
jgi:ferrous iron transport protein A